MSEQLTDGERTILRGIVKLGNRVPASEVAKFTKQKEERVVSIMNSLVGRGIIRLETHEITSFTLTDEGREYANEGLPESRLVRAIALEELLVLMMPSRRQDYHPKPRGLH